MLEQKIKPMLAQLSEPFDSPDYLYEIKWDGTRCLAFISRGKVRLQNRRLHDITYRYPELQDLPKHVKAHSAILDGEIVILEGGKPNFEKLQEREHIDDENVIEIRASLLPATYIVFDILYVDGQDVTQKPLWERKQILSQTVREDTHIVVADYVEKEGKLYFEEAVKKHLEGIIAKERNSPYLIGERSHYWLKIKKKMTQDAIICGYTRGYGHRTMVFGALILGAYDRKGELVHIGDVGTGFSDEEIERLFQILRKLEVSHCPFRKKPEVPKHHAWVEPKLICEVEFVEWTSESKMRAPRYKGLREDKDLVDCVIER